MNKDEAVFHQTGRVIGYAAFVVQKCRRDKSNPEMMIVDSRYIDSLREELLDLIILAPEVAEELQGYLPND